MGRLGKLGKALSNNYPRYPCLHHRPPQRSIISGRCPRWGMVAINSPQPPRMPRLGMTRLFIPHRLFRLSRHLQATATLLRKPHFVLSAGSEGGVETSGCKGVFYTVKTASFCGADHDTTTTLDTLRFVHALWRLGVYGTRRAEAGAYSAGSTFFRCGRPNWYSARLLIGSIAWECIYYTIKIAIFQ